MEDIKPEDKITISKKIFRHLIGEVHYPLASHTFMGKCQCLICEAFRCFRIDTYRDYKWLIMQLNDRRNIQVNPMSEEEFDVSCEVMKSIGKNIPIEI